MKTSPSAKRRRDVVVPRSSNERVLLNSQKKIKKNWEFSFFIFFFFSFSFLLDKIKRMYGVRTHPIMEKFYFACHTNNYTTQSYVSGFDGYC